MEDSTPKRSRRWFIGSGLAAAGVGAWWFTRKTPYEPSIDVAPGKRVLAAYPSVDVHSHPGRTFLTDGNFDSIVFSSMANGFEAERVADMRLGNVTASLFSIVADVQVLSLSLTSGVSADREFEPGEAIADFERQLNRFNMLADSGVITFARTADEVRQAHRDNRSVAVLSSEGADFVEDKLERLESVYKAGMRAITLVHYRPSEYGDGQTITPVHGGLSDLGARVVEEMNRLGIVIDMAHASFSTIRDVVDLTTAPILLSHSHLLPEGGTNARLITQEHAMIVAETGGVIGSWPAGITSQTMNDFVDETFRLIDLVGINHVSIGTDLDANYKPVLTDYVQFPEFASLLLARGLADEEAGKVLGTNFLRVFDAVKNTRSA